jgi:nitrite reductase/ring-hydroxylating ferredoxin subunit
MKKEDFHITRRKFILGIVSGCACGVACTSSEDSVALEPYAIGLISDFRDGVTPLEQLRISIEKTTLDDTITFRALQLICTHQACALRAPAELPAKKNDIIYSCPCHGAKFDYQGNVLSGPARTPLVWRKLSVSNENQVFLHHGEFVEHNWLLTIFKKNDST